VTGRRKNDPAPRKARVIAVRTDQCIYDAARAVARAEGTTLSQWVENLLARELGRAEDAARTITTTPVEPVFIVAASEPFPPTLAGLIRHVSITASVAQPAEQQSGEAADAPTGLSPLPVSG
jgi:hypothetical protein